MLEAGFKWYALLLKFKKYIRAFKYSFSLLLRFWSMCDSVSEGLAGFLNSIIIWAAGVLRSNNIDWPFEIVDLISRWRAFFEQVCWDFWLLWCETFLMLYLYVVRLFTFLHLRWVLEQLYELWLLWLWAYMRFLWISESLGWAKFFVSILVRAFYASAVVKRAWSDFIALCKDCKKTYSLRARGAWLRLWGFLGPFKAFAIEIFGPVKLMVLNFWKAINFYWSLINWEREPAKFLRAFCSALALKFSAYQKSLAFFYRGLLYSVFEHFALAFEGGAFDLLKFFVWLTFYLTLWTHWVYFYYLSCKLLFFTLKYLWDFAFFFVDFFFCYFFSNTIIFTLYKHTLQKLYKVVNFFIFYGIPNLVSSVVWAERFTRAGKRLSKFFEKASEKGVYFLEDWIPDKLDLIGLGLANFRAWVWSFIVAAKNLKFKAYQSVWRQHDKFLLGFYINRYYFSKEGFVLWGRGYKRRASILLGGANRKLLKSLASLLNNQTSYKFAKIKALLFSKAAQKPFFLTRKAYFMLLPKLWYYKALVFYSKLIRAFSFFGLSVARFFISAQCFYFAVANYFSALFIDFEHGAMAASTKRLIKLVKFYTWLE